MSTIVQFVLRSLSTASHLCTEPLGCPQSIKNTFSNSNSNSKHCTLHLSNHVCITPLSVRRPHSFLIDCVITGFAQRNHPPPRPPRLRAWTTWIPNRPVTSQAMALKKQNAWTAFQLLQVPLPMLMVKNGPQLISLTTAPKAGHQPKDMTKSASQGIL